MSTEQSVSPAAISRILAGRGFKKVIVKAGCWSAGFKAVACGTSVRVFYTANSGHEHEARQEIVKLINERPGEKYWATLETMIGGIEVVMIHPYDKDDPRQKETPEVETEPQQEPPVEEEASPAPVALVEIREVLSPVCREFMDVSGVRQAGWVVENDSHNDGLVRVSYRDHPDTKYYEKISGNRERHATLRVEDYANLLMEAGYDVIYDGGWDCLVDPSKRRDKGQTKEAFDALRDAVEDAALSFMTRKGGPKSLFIYYLVPFKDKVRRLEVFWRDDAYHSASLQPHGKPKMISTSDVQKVVDFCREQLDW